MKLKRALLPALALSLCRQLVAQDLLLKDDFNDRAIDSSLWQVSLPFSNPPPTTAMETNGNLVLFRRGVLSGNGTFDGSLDIQGKFRFTGEGDTLSVVFRSDLTVTNQAERRGVQVALKQGTGRVFVIPEPFVSAPITGAYDIAKDQDVTFRITDNNDVVKLYLDDLFSPVMSVTVTNRRGNRIALYNFNGTSSRAQVDYFSIHRLRTTVFLDGKLVHEGPVQKSSAVQVRLQPYYTNSATFYTLDGSEPSFVSTEYQGQFTLNESATVRAVSYRADFLESSESPTIEVQIVPDVVLTNETPGGGIVTFDPTGPAYPSNSVVSMSALPAPGWQFLRWEGAAGGNATNATVTMTNHLAVRAVFVTTLALTSIGSGQVATYPTGVVHAYGARVRLMGLPATGNYFFRWANSVTGNASPATLIVTNSTPGVSALFSTLAANQVSLTTMVNGAGTISLSPALNVLTNGATATLAALPDVDQVFLGWSGDAGGVLNPYRLVMNGNKTVTARFAPGVKFLPNFLSYATNGFGVSMKGVPGFAFTLQASSNLFQWQPVAALTNASGLLPYQHLQAISQPMLFYRVVVP